MLGPNAPPFSIYGPSSAQPNDPIQRGRAPFSLRIEKDSAGQSVDETLVWVSQERWDLRSLPQSLRAYQESGHLPILYPKVIHSMSIVLPIWIPGVERHIQLVANPAHPETGITLAQVMMAVHKSMTAQITPEDMKTISDIGYMDMCDFATELRGETSNQGDGTEYVMRYCDTTWIDWPLIVEGFRRPYNGPSGAGFGRWNIGERNELYYSWTGIIFV